MPSKIILKKMKYIFRQNERLLSAAGSHCKKHYEFFLLREMTPDEERNEVYRKRQYVSKHQ